MHYTAPITGYMTNKGYLYCTPCAEARDQKGAEVYGDNAAFFGDCCDVCTTVFARQRSTVAAVRAQNAVRAAMKLAASRNSERQ
jgi:hypothetical protein